MLWWLTLNMKTKYEILYDVEIEVLIQDVQTHLEFGWVLLGRPFVLPTVYTLEQYGGAGEHETYVPDPESGGHPFVAQAMTLEIEDDYDDRLVKRKES